MNILNKGPIRYWNQGPDRRYEGPLAIVPKFVQTALSYYSNAPSKSATIDLADGGIAQVSWPPYVGVFVSRGADDHGVTRYRSFRLGWHDDPNTGDGANPREPVHDPPGAKIFDVRIKSDIDNVVRQ